MMVRALLSSPVGKTLIWLVGGVLIIVIATAYGQILLNRWNKPFFDALSRRDFHEFLVQLGIFFLIAGVVLVLNVAQRWLVELLKLKLREGLVHDLLQGWMLPRRAFWLAHAGPMGVNPDQRMHEDARKLCDLSADLGIGLLQASILFATFAGVLWILSKDFSFRIADTDYAVPGFMLWAAITYAGCLLYTSLIIGEPGAGKTLLFRALAGLWPWGAGRITRPRGEELWYMPRTPYLPPGTLGEVLAYPLKVESFRARAFTDALQLLGLRRLVPMLAMSRRWDRELSDEEQQSLAFARMVLHAPRWVLIDEVLDSIDEETRERVINIFATDLKHTGIIHIGRGRARDSSVTRVLHLLSLIHI